LSLHCDSCKKETTWLELQGSSEGSGRCHAGYVCGYCQGEYYHFYLYNDTKQRKIYKIGQHPEPSIAVSKRLESGLKGSLQHYRRGLVCFNQGYGIAAVAYFRRVVEERTDELIDVVAELAVANGQSKEEAERIRTAKSERTYDKKLEVASGMIPASLRPGGVNPLGRLHSLLSEALHSRPEEESIKVAEELKFLLDHVFSNLKDYIDAQRMYAIKIQNAGRFATPAADEIPDKKSVP
jgi:flagellar motility protein MotE (MotC chaperone)